MRPSGNIEDAVKNMSFTAGPELDRCLWQGMTETRRPPEMTTRECGPVRMWRLCMNSKIAKLTLVGIIGTAVLAGICRLGVPVDGASVAMAQMRQAIDNVPWMHVLTTIETEQGPNRNQEEWIGFDRSIEVRKAHDGTVRYHDGSRDTLSVYDPGQGTVTITSLSDRYAVPRRRPLPGSAAETVTAMLDTLQGQANKATLSMTEEQIEGRQVQIIRGQYQLEEDDITQDTTVVIDAQSKLPISIDATATKDDATVLAQLHAVFDYPEDGPATIYEVGVPTDAMVIDRRPRPEAADDAQIEYHVTTGSDTTVRETLMLYGAVNIDLVEIPAGEFLMGSPDTEVGYPALFLERFGDRIQKKYGSLRPTHEGPQHRVKIAQGFYLSQCEVTCGQFRAFRPQYRRLPHSVGPLDGKMTRLTMDADDQPAGVSLQDALAFCEWISEKTGLTVRLPSEAEWEYACRAGTQTRFYWGDAKEQTGDYANVADQTYEKVDPESQYTLNTNDGSLGPAPVGQYLPNGFGLYDMIGNASEWIQGCYSNIAYSIDPQDKRFDSKIDESWSAGFRGGSYMDSLKNCRSASRGLVHTGSPQSESDSPTGFRILIEK